MNNRFVPFKHEIDQNFRQHTIKTYDRKQKSEFEVKKPVTS